MGTTKYIVNNLTGQTISGDLTIEGNLNVNGVITNNLPSYKALLTQTGVIVGTNISVFNYSLIIGETYTISNYVASDDFSNVANVVSGNINETGCVFIATGNTPSVWNNGSELTSSGNLVVDVLENNLGFNIFWYDDFAPGIYIAFNSITGPIYNSFDRTKTMVTTQGTFYFNSPPLPYINYYSQPGSFLEKDDAVVLIVWDSDGYLGVSDILYYTPIEIKIKQDNDTTPIVINGSIIPSFPFSYASIDLICNGQFIENFVGNNVTVNNMTELITELNTNEATSYLGTYSDDGMGGVLLTIPTNKANQFCSGGLLSFQVYAD